MGKTATGRTVLATLGALLIAALSVTGCVSMPTGGPVQSYPVTQGTDAQSQQYMQIQPQPPGSGWNPQQIVEGFLTASASFGNYGQVARDYLTPTARQGWNPNWSAIVYKSGPLVSAPTYASSSPKSSTAATVQVTGTIQASLKGSGSYSVPSSSSQDAEFYAPDAFQLKKVGGQWRISYAPPELLLTSNSFERDYQLQNLYFFDPTGKYLVPDPVYVPLGASPEALVTGLVSDLITPPGDWLSEKGAKATETAFPAGTQISKTNGVVLNGVTAVVNLTGTIAKANSQTMEQVSAQLLSTLRGAAAQGGTNGQSVQSVEILLNGKPWAPNGQDNPIQQQTPQYTAPDGKSSNFYYVDSSGYLTSSPSAGGSAHRLAKIGTGYSQIAVTPDGDYVAALRGSTLYAGIIGQPLVEQGTGYLAMSWDIDDALWASTAEGQIVMFRASTDARHPLGPAVTVKVNNPIAPPYTALKVAPDGVRVAIVQDGGILTYGAISGRQGPNPQIWLSTVQEDPLTSPQSSPDALFKAIAWYGPGNVIALATPGPAVTEYPVSGGTPFPIPTDSDMQTIAASYQQPLIAGLSTGLASDASTTGSWMQVTDNGTPVNGSAPAYPG